MDNTTVVIGCSKDLDYAFLIPITARLWSDVIGFSAMPMLVGYEEEWLAPTHLRTVHAALVEHSGLVCIRRAEGYPDHSTAQNCRQHAAALISNDDTWLLPADADLWPLRRDFYHQHEGTEHRAVCLYSNGDHFSNKHEVLARAKLGLGTQTIPTCHVAMRARDWRAIYKPIPGDVAGSIKKTLDAWMPTRVEVPGYDKGFHLWMADQQIMTVALCRQPWFPHGALLVPRDGHPPKDRLDRSHPADWDGPFDSTRWTDAHVFKQPYSDEHWPSLLRIVDTVMPQHSAWAREYRENFVRAL